MLIEVIGRVCDFFNRTSSFVATSELPCNILAYTPNPLKVAPSWWLSTGPVPTTTDWGLGVYIERPMIEVLETSGAGF